VKELCTVILAAGQGTRMRSKLPKVLHQVAGLPMIAYAVEACRAVRAKRTLAVARIPFEVPRGAALAERAHDPHHMAEVVALREERAAEGVGDEALDPGADVLVDPGHAWRYGTSVRAAAHRDVFLEEVKDAALAIYSRSVAIRVTDRIRAVGNFQTMTESHAQELAVRYDLDYLVSDRQLALPPVFRAGRFVVYQLGR